LPSPDAPATIINLTTGSAWQVFAHLSGYSISKLASQQQVQYIATGYAHAHITDVAIHPGLVDTDIMLDSFRRFKLQSSTLIGGLAVWWWSVGDLVARKEEIVKEKLLRVDLTGTVNNLNNKVRLAINNIEI
jgi:NAD(P)-dependent dehydrogenase (short-subunit alcohol dehydrogenase family)